MAFKDVNPVAPTHFLVIPKNRDGLTGISKAEDRHKELLGHMMVVAANTAREQGLGDGYRLVINDGKNGCNLLTYQHFRPECVSFAHPCYWRKATLLASWCLIS